MALLHNFFTTVCTLDREGGVSSARHVQEVEMFSVTMRLRLILVAALGLAAPWFAAHAQQLPDTPEVRAVQAFVEALNAGTPEKIRTFVDVHVAGRNEVRELFFNEMSRLSRDTGGIDLEFLLRRPDGIVVVRGRTRKSNTPIGIELNRESEEPFRFLGIKPDASGGDAPGGPGTIPRPRADPNMDDGQRAAAWDRYVSQVAANDLFSGVVLVARDDHIVFEHAYGLASKRFKVPNRIDTRFNLGSVNKAITKTAILQLMAQGRVDLDATIATYLPDYPQATGTKITVRHLLTHTSGLGEIFTPEFRRASKDQFREPRDFFPLFINAPLKFEPGKGNSYSNAGYVVLGAIVESVCRCRYYDHVKEHIYAPAGMVDTDALEADAPVENVAEGYQRVSGASGQTDWRNNQYVDAIKGSPAGGAYSTAHDLLRFVQALKRGVLLPASLAGTVFGRPLPPAQTAGKRNEESSQAITLPNVAISGGSPGVNAMVQVSGPYTIVVLSNYDPPAATSLGAAVAGLLEGGQPRP
jgi:CubicO group peptidase (beta-lactamase class C family)